MKLLLLSSFVLMGTFVAGENTIGGCFDTFVNQLNGNEAGSSDACPAIKDYVKCVQQATDLEHADGVKEFFQKSESALNNTFADDGCNVDFSEIFGGVENENAASTGENTIGGCFHKFWQQVQENSFGAPAFCGFIEDYQKCVMQAKDVVKVDGVKEYFKKSESVVKNQMKRMAGCTLEFSFENAGSTTIPTGWLLVMVTSVLLILQQF